MPQPLVPTTWNMVFLRHIPQIPFRSHFSSSEMFISLQREIILRYRPKHIPFLLYYSDGTPFPLSMDVSTPQCTPSPIASWASYLVPEFGGFLATFPDSNGQYLSLYRNPQPPSSPRFRQSIQLPVRKQHYCSSHPSHLTRIFIVGSRHPHSSYPPYSSQPASCS